MSEPERGRDGGEAGADASEGAAPASTSRAAIAAAPPPPQPQLPTPEELRDLGFGSRVAQQSRQRLLNRDGSFNVFRRGLSFFGRLDTFHALLTMSWRRFFGLSFAFYVVVNVLFAAGYMLCGPGALSGVSQAGWPERLPWAFFFSVETFTTVGYGNIAPQTITADVLVTLEAFIGLLATALVTGIAFARFARPVASIAFSKNAVIAPYRGGAALMFRMINRRRSELSSLEAQVVLALVEERRGIRARRFHTLPLERSQVAFFPLSWTVVHPIVRESPLCGMTPERLDEGDAELLVLITAIDDKLSQTTQARTSYAAEEIVWGARFADMFEPPDGGPLAVDVEKLDEIEPAELPPGCGRPALPT
ncbi:MAG TPA: ion channel [Thermoanaerobaculia bacterium]|nr:ion channel [Thermoanaerobaculia bacterium]